MNMGFSSTLLGFLFTTLLLGPFNAHALEKYGRSWFTEMAYRCLVQFRKEEVGQACQYACSRERHNPGQNHVSDGAPANRLHTF
jgi:hypothetical protein